MFSQPAYRSSSVIKARLLSYFSAGIMKAKKFVLHKHPVGEPKITDFELVEEELPPVKDGEIAVKTLFLTVDPYMRYMSRRVKIGAVMPGQVVARVLESKHSGYKVGDTVLVYCGWQSALVFNPDVTILPGLFDNNETMTTVVLPSFGGLSESLALGVLGMPGITALYGLIEITKPKAGETLVVSTAAGAVGSIVGQLGKILGLKVIGFTGADDKVEWLKKDLKFDHAYNYKTKSVTEALKECAPEGVDIYFDNVGGTITYEVMQQMNSFGRVSCCGAISIYNHADAETPPMVPSTQGFVIFKQLSLHGFVVTRWRKEWNQGIQQLLGYIKQGKLHFQETVTEGFENTPKAFIEMLRGENTGKAIIKA